jgi:alpha-tubulin suppressor-like RCC1 family protein
LPVASLVGNITQVAAGATVSFGVRVDGTLFGWGWPQNGELGLGDTSARISPTSISSLASVSYVACGFYHTFVMITNGSVYSMGDNTYGQLGLGDTISRLFPTMIPSLVNITQISASQDHSVVLMNSQVYVFGLNNGFLGLGTNSTNETSPLLLLV